MSDDGMTGVRYRSEYVALQCCWYKYGRNGKRSISQTGLAKLYICMQRLQSLSFEPICL